MIFFLSSIEMLVSAADAPDRTIHRTERAAAGFGDNHGLAHADRELAEHAQRNRDVECHARPQLGGDAGVEAEDAALAPVGREGNADAVAGALLEIFGIAGAIDHLLAGNMRRLAGSTGTDRLDRCFK